MKTFSLIAPLLLALLTGCSGQDIDARFVDFLNQTLSGFGDWLKENNYVPDPIPGEERFLFNGTSFSGIPRYEILGEMRNRFYHGSEENISARSISSNLTDLSFIIDFTYGTGSSDYVTGQYSIKGEMWPSIPISGSGNFTRSNQSRTPLSVQKLCNLGVSPDGYFRLSSCSGVSTGPKFEEFELEGLDARGNEWRIQPFINSWYEMQMPDQTEMSFRHFSYMIDIFEVTPIVDIIGETLPPTMTLSEDNFKSCNVVRKSEQYLDEESNEIVQKDFINFSN